MGRHKTTGKTDEERAELYKKYIEPNHALVRANVARFSQKKSNIDDNFQDMCQILLRGVDTYNPEMDIGNWIISICRRDIGKLEARLPTYVDAKKGSDFEYVTEHHGYKKKYRRKKDKDFVNVHNESVFKSDPNELFFSGIGDNLMKIISELSPNLDFSNGCYSDIENAIMNGDDTDFMLYFRKYYYNQKVKDISSDLNISESDIKVSINRFKNRLQKVLDIYN